MNSTLKLLESHSGRGRILRTVQYGSKMVAGTTFVNEQSRNGLLVLSSQLGLCRTILRLFDDLPMLSYTMSYGLGSQEKSVFIRLITLVQNFTDQLFFPIEHIAWASDAGILKISSARWNNLCVYCWLISLSITITRNLIQLTKLRQREAKKRSTDASGSVSRKLSPEELWTSLSIVSELADLAICIHFMPSGFLWSGKLTTFVVGLLGLISSLIPLWRLVQSQR
ncbi:peroxisomal membrane protein 11C-like [Apostichopus japonicus]|uniref:peroxisomal membrane protein 11C-like n=1 Tax=Stichopus japonicus TaxID=307972 RepID=UPI003AB848A0